MFASHQMPGLFQTQEYAAAIFRLGQPTMKDEEIQRRVDVRMARQDRLTTDPVTVRAVLGEAVLRCRVGSAEVTAKQLLRVNQIGELPNVLIQALPFISSAYADAKPFILLDFERGDPGLTYIEHRTGALYLDKPEEIGSFRMIFEQLQAAALGPDESRSMIAAAAQQHT